MGKNFSSSKISSLPIDTNFLGKYKNDYKIIKIMKKDFIYTIYGAINIKNKEVCLKVYNKKKLKMGDYDYFIDLIKREEEIVKLCKCGNIVNIYKKIETEDDIIFEIDSWDFTLADFIENRKRPLDLKFFLNFLLEITNILIVLNEKEVMHRDIRPSNIFVIEDKNKLYHYKLGGFGHSIYIKDNTSEPVGTYFYSAPEIIKNLQYDEKCDLWSLGITLYELVFKELPYGKNVTINMVEQSIYYEDNFYYKKSKYPQINTIFKNLLIVNRKNRINFEQFFNCITFFKNEVNDFSNFAKVEQSLPENIKKNLIMILYMKERIINIYTEETILVNT